MPEGFDIAAVIAAAISAGISILSIIITKRNDTSLEYLKNELETKKDEQTARRDYEYDARKRLYQECEPILFQFSELSESALRRIYALSRNAKQGNLGPERHWLSTDHYFIRSTIYRLIAPMAAFKLLQHRLTSIDLKLDKSINIQYILAKILYYTFSSSPELSQTEPTITYDPDFIGTEFKGLIEDEKKEARSRYPEKYWLQGLKVGTIDVLAESLILANKDTESRIKSFGEFEQEFFEGIESRTGDDKRFEVFITLFSYFHPKTRPVLWRVLITQAYLYNAIRNIRNIEQLKITNLEQLKETFDIEKTKSNCDWKQADEVVSDKEFNAPFQASENYLRRQLLGAF